MWINLEFWLEDNNIHEKRKELWVELPFKREYIKRKVLTKIEIIFNMDKFIDRNMYEFEKEIQELFYSFEKELEQIDSPNKKHFLTHVRMFIQKIYVAKYLHKEYQLEPREVEKMYFNYTEIYSMYWYIIDFLNTLSYHEKEYRDEMFSILFENNIDIMENLQ